MTIEDFVAAMQNKDYAALAECFEEDCRLFDYCPSVAGGQNTFLYGRRAVEMYYHNALFFGAFAMRDPQIMDEFTVNFYADYRGKMIHAVAQIEGDQGIACIDGSCPIKEMVIRPA